MSRRRPALPKPARTIISDSRSQIAVIAEVYFDVYDGMESLADFHHVRFQGLGSAVVLQTVALALIAHFEKLNVGGLVFQAATGDAVNPGRRTTLEEIYDYLLGLKSELR